MKLVTVSDYHGLLPSYLPSGDILIIGGDNEPDNNPDGQADWIDSTFRKWLNRCRANYKEVIYYFGNHSFVGEAFEAEIFNPELPKKFTKLFESLPMRTIANGMIDMFGLNFRVCSYCLQVGDWAFGLSEEQYAILCDSWQPCDILLTHGCAYGFLDKAYAYWDREKEQQIGFEYHHTGSKSLLNWILKNRPKLVVQNHIHEAFGASKVTYEDGSTTEFVNASQVNRAYRLMNRPVEIFLN